MRRNTWVLRILSAIFLIAVIIIVVLLINGKLYPDKKTTYETVAAVYTEENTAKPVEEVPETVVPTEGATKPDVDIVTESKPAETSAATNEVQDKEAPSGNVKPEDKADVQEPVQKSEEKPKPTPEPTPKPAPEPASEPANIVPDFVENKVETIADKDVKASDYLEVIGILAGKLSLGEIKYLFDSAKSDYWETTPVEEIEKAREILFSKLSDEDLDKLYQLGRKYGRSMTLLKKDIDVAEVKEKQMRKKGLIK